MLTSGVDLADCTERWKHYRTGWQPFYMILHGLKITEPFERQARNGSGKTAAFALAAILAKLPMIHHGASDVSQPDAHLR